MVGAERLPCLAVVRNPVAVLGFVDTVQLPVHQGRVPAAERFDRPLRTALDAEPDVLHRRIVVLNWFFACYERELRPARIIRYEDVVGSDGAVLRQNVAMRGHRASGCLSSRNANPLYREVALEAILDALLAAGGPWTRFYAPCECRAVANAYSGRGRRLTFAATSSALGTSAPVLGRCPTERRADFARRGRFPFARKIEQMAYIFGASGRLEWNATWTTTAPTSSPSACGRCFADLLRLVFPEWADTLDFDNAEEVSAEHWFA